MNINTRYKTARVGTYYNGHDSQLIDQLNEVLQDVREDTIVHELFINYFDDQDIEGIIEFFNDRFREHDINKKALDMAKQDVEPAKQDKGIVKKVIEELTNISEKINELNTLIDEQTITILDLRDDNEVMNDLCEDHTDTIRVLANTIERLNIEKESNLSTIKHLRDDRRLQDRRLQELTTKTK